MAPRRWLPKGSGASAVKEDDGASDEKAEVVRVDEEGDGDADPMKNPDLAWMPEDWRQALVDQTYVKPTKEATFFQLFRHSTAFELFLNALGIICAIVAGVAQPGMTVFFGNLTTDFTVWGKALIDVQNGADPAVLVAARDQLFRSVDKDAAYLVAVGAALFVATFVYTATWIYTGESTSRRIRELYLKSVLHQNVAYFDKLGAGEVTTRIQNDTHLIQDGISDKLPLSVSFIAQFFAGFIIAYARNWRLALILSSIIPVILMAGLVMNKFESRYRTQMLEQTALGGTMAEESISSVRNAHAFGTQSKLVALYDKYSAATLAIGRKSAIVHSIGMMIFFFVIYGAYALAFWEGSRLLVQGHISAGGVINVFFSILIASFSLAQLAPNLQAVSSAQGAAAKLFATIDRVPPIDSASPAGLRPDTCEGRLEFRDVHFVYPSRPKVHVLKGFSSVFARGKSTALVGQSGCGKSTIIGLIERFYDPVQGAVYLDGRDLRTYNLKWLRAQIGLVMQEPTLFAMTVYENVALGLIGTEFESAERDVKRRMVEEACVKANAHTFVTALQKGYDTHIGERGSLLSGGQKQRVAIARAVVSDPKILLLDEATSALDTGSEGIVQDALDKASSGRTTVTIAHRLSTIKNAERIVVMRSGEIVETGNHASLLEQPEGHYKRLVEAQKLRDELDEDEPKLAKVVLEAEKANPLVHRTSTRLSAGLGALKGQEGAESRERTSFAYAFYRMGRLNKDSAWLYLFGITASGIIGVVYPVFGIVFGSILSVFSDTDPEKILAGGRKYGLYLFIICLVATVATFFQNWCMTVSAERLSAIMRTRTFRAIMRQDIAFFDHEEHASGKLTADISGLAQKVNGLAGSTLGVIVQSVVVLIAGVIIAVITQWRIGLVGASLTPILVGAGILRLHVVVLKDAKTKKAHEQSAQLACEAAGAIRTVAALTREDHAWHVYRSSLDEPQRKSNRIAVWSNLLYSFGQGCVLWSIALLFWYGSRKLIDDNLSTREFFTCLICTIFASIQAGSIFNWVPDMSKAKSAALDFLKLVDARPSIDAEHPTGEACPPVSGHVVLKDIYFRYASRPDVRVLRGLDIEVKPGQFAALVGPSGCGKSTIIALVERFYDPVSGRVFVDGRDIGQLNVVGYRKNVSLVSQEPTLYAGSIRFNILLGANRPENEIPQEEVERACQQANIHDFVVSLPDGYDTDVGGKGTMLSGGQKQRIAIARALIRDPRILLLDEATSALDSESEKVVQVALDKAAKGRTTIAVAHRISSIQNADVIFVLQDGRVAERGRHQELLARKGIYFELVAQQGLERA